MDRSDVASRLERAGFDDYVVDERLGCRVDVARAMVVYADREGYGLRGRWIKRKDAD